MFPGLLISSLFQRKLLRRPIPGLGTAHFVSHVKNFILACGSFHNGADACSTSGAALAGKVLLLFWQMPPRARCIRGILKITRNGRLSNRRLLHSRFARSPVYILESYIGAVSRPLTCSVTAVSLHPLAAEASRDGEKWSVRWGSYIYGAQTASLGGQWRGDGGTRGGRSACVRLRLVVCECG